MIHSESFSLTEYSTEMEGGKGGGCSYLPLSLYKVTAKPSQDSFKSCMKHLVQIHFLYKHFVEGNHTEKKTPQADVTVVVSTKKTDFGRGHPRPGRSAWSEVLHKSPRDIAGQADRHNSKAGEKHCDGQALSKGAGKIICLLPSIIQIKAICPMRRPMKKPM